MPVWIDKVTVENLGPLREKSFDLKRFNLFYGLNETGKTFLVEFLVQSLFRHASQWDLREISGRGKVTLSGIDDDVTPFTLDSRRKLEDYWEEEDIGLPANMARLLVVKGGELELSSGVPGGVGRSVLKSALSRESLLEEILTPIQDTVKEAQVDSGTIIADRRGKVRERIKVKEELDKTESLMEDVEEQYSRGAIHSLEIKLDRIENSLEIQGRAKRHHAYRLYNQLQDLRQERKNLPDRKLENLRDHLRDFQNLTKKIAQRQQDLREKEDTSQHYRWLKNAKETWETERLDQPGRPRTLYGILGLLLSMTGAVLGLLNFTLPAVLLSLTGTLILSYYLWRFHTWSQSVGSSLERANIEEAFQERFGDELSGLAELKTQLEKIQESHIQAKQLEDDLSEDKQKKDQLEIEIRSLFDDLTGETVREKDWDETMNSLRERAAFLDDEIKNLEIKLSALSVDRDEYHSQPASEKYQPEKLKSLAEEASTIKSEIHSAEDDLENLKHSICSATGDEIDTPWNTVLQHLRSRHQEKLDEYKSLTAEIVAKIGVARVLDRVRKEEDQKIREGLTSKEVIHNMKSVTEEYASLDLEGEELIVEGEYGNYPLRELSTGAREQIQLALRMGFASRLAGGNPLFMILDDAFQHSDWQRRKHLVKRVIQLAQKDWQVTYLTMDDHLRDLFREAGKQVFEGEFFYQEL